jgi:hypothetical protein
MGYFWRAWLTKSCLAGTLDVQLFLVRCLASTQLLHDLVLASTAQLAKVNLKTGLLKSV